MDAVDYAESIAEFFASKTCSGKGPTIVARGLTAGIAPLMASRHPERIERLILRASDRAEGTEESGAPPAWSPFVGLLWAEPVRLSQLPFPRTVSSGDGYRVRARRRRTAQ